MVDTYRNPVPSVQIEPQTLCPPRKLATRQPTESGRESSDLLVGAALIVAVVALLVAPLALAELLPSWLVLLSLALGAVALVVRGAR